MPETAAHDLLSYIDASPSPFHAVREAATRLEAAGFRQVSERDAWSLSPGDRVYVVRDGATLAALEATLRLYRDPEKALREVPTLRMLTVLPAELKERCERFAARLRGIPGLSAVEVREDVAYVGGGSLPDQPLPTFVVALTPAGQSESEFAVRLRTGTPAAVGRVQDGKVLLDLRTVFERQEDELFEAIRTGVL